MGEVDLAFMTMKAGKLISFLEERGPPGAKVAFNKESIALRISGLPRFEVSDGANLAHERAIKCFEAAQTLLRFWESNRTFFDGHFAASLSGESGSMTSVNMA